MRLPLLIAARLRLRRTPSGTKASPGVVIATIGVAVAIMVMLLSVGIADGFRRQISDKISGFEASIAVIPADPEAETLTLTPELLQLLQAELPAGARLSPSLDRAAVVKADRAFAGLVVRSLPDTLASRFILGHVAEGEARQPGATEVILSRATARQLGLKVGDRPYVSYFAGERIRTRRLTVSAIYDTHFHDFDTRLAWASLEPLQRIDRQDASQATELQVYGIDDSQIEEAAARLHTALVSWTLQGGQPLQVVTVHERGALYYSWLDLLGTNVAVILTLMAVVAAFTLVASTFIIILERVSMIGILKTLGMANSAIREIFVYMGLRLVGIGLIAGNALGLGLLLLQQWLRIVPLNPDTYYLDCVPVSVSWGAVGLINLGAVALAALILLIPTRVICGMSVASTTKFE